MRKPLWNHKNDPRMNSLIYNFAKFSLSKNNHIYNKHYFAQK